MCGHDGRHDGLISLEFDRLEALSRVGCPTSQLELDDTSLGNGRSYGNEIWNQITPSAAADDHDDSDVQRPVLFTRLWRARSAV